MLKTDSGKDSPRRPQSHEDRQANDDRQLQDDREVPVGGAVQAVADGAPRADALRIGDFTIHSRLIIGSGKYPSAEVMRQAIEASGADMITVAIRRVDLTDRSANSILGAIDQTKIQLLPNTAGCYNAKDAILTARLGREALGTSLVKLEVIGDERTLFPDGAGLLEAAAVLVKDGFTVLPYTNDDPILARRLVEVGCLAVMPLGAPIGSGLGIRNPYNLRILMETLNVKVIVDAGVGTPTRPAMRLAVRAGWLAAQSGRIARKLYATASSPLDGVIQS